MDSLVRIDNNNIVTSSRQVAEVFSKRNSEVNRAIENIIKDMSDNETLEITHSAKISNEIFKENYFTTPNSNGRKYKEYLMNRDGFTILAMGFTGSDALQWKLKYIEAFNKMEEQIKDQPIPEINSQFMYQLAQEMEMKEKQIQEMKPKALFADAVQTSDDSILVGELAKIISQNGVEIGQNRLFKWLRDNNYLIKRNGESYNAPTQYSMDLKLMETKVTTISDSKGKVLVRHTPKITGKGQIYFINKFIDNNKRSIGEYERVTE